MGKHHETLKQGKKKPLHTPKEKKAMKMAKKHEREHPVPPLIPETKH
jgi:hypothetical protein